MKNRHSVAAVTLGTLAAGGVLTAVLLTGGSSPAAAPAGRGGGATTATINVATLSVNGKQERVLVNSRGLPLYTFGGDSRSTSAVQGQLAALWPPLVSTAPTQHGTAGTLGVVRTTNGTQVQFDGHFLYTFVEDSAGRVTGQGVQGFFVATPGAAPPGSASVSAAPSRSGPYGY